MNNKWLVIAAFSALSAAPAFAGTDSVIKDQSGSMFMEEEAPKAPPQPPRTRMAIPRIIDSNGNVEPMQTITQPINNNAPSTHYREPDNYGNLGVSTDESGNIIPLINRNGPPVVQLGGQLQEYNEFAPVPVPGYLPGQLFGVGGYPSFVGPYGGGFNPYMGPRYGGYAPNYGNVANLRIGNLNIGLGSNYGYGPGFGGGFYPGFGNPFAGFNAGIRPFGMPTVVGSPAPNSGGYPGGFGGYGPGGSGGYGPGGYGLGFGAFTGLGVYNGTGDAGSIGPTGLGGGIFSGSSIFGGYSSGTSLFSPFGGFSNNNTTTGPFSINSSSSTVAF